MWGTVTALHWITCHALVFLIHVKLDYCSQVHDRANYSQEPINCNDESDVISRKSNRGEYNHHGDQACLRDAGSSNTGCSCCNTWLKGNTQTYQPVPIAAETYFYFFLQHIFTFNLLFFKKSYLIVMIWPKFISILLTWAMKMAARASYRAVPSMLMVAPTGSTKRVIRLSILLFSSRHLNVTGRVAELPDKRPKQLFFVLRNTLIF